MENCPLRKLLFTAAVCGLLAACTLPGAQPLPTPYPPGYLPTVIHMTAQAIQSATEAAAASTPAPTQTPTPLASLVPPTAAPSPTSTAGPRIPLAAIQIDAPGPMSRVVSPVQIQMLVMAGDSRRVEVDLFDQVGNRLGRKLLAVVGSPAGDPLTVKIPFEIRVPGANSFFAGENGYIQVSTNDAHGRVQSLTTLQVLLLSSGENQINPPGNTIYERVVLAHLSPGAQIGGGVLGLEGQILPYNRQPVVIQLISDDGKNHWVRVLTTTGTDWQSFSTTVPFKVTVVTPARLFIQQADDLLSTQAYIYSVPIVLNP